jgi:hypothetical protein
VERLDSEGMRVLRDEARHDSLQQDGQGLRAVVVNTDSVEEGLRSVGTVRRIGEPSQLRSIQVGAVLIRKTVTNLTVVGDDVLLLRDDDVQRGLEVKGLHGVSPWKLWGGCSTP